MNEAIRILVVDDDPNIGELLRLYLEKEGYAVTVASDALTQIVFGEIYTDTDQGVAFGGNLYLEKNLGPAYFDGVRNGDWFEFKINVEKAGDYHFCFSFGWVEATGT